MKVSIAGQSRASDDAGPNQDHFTIVRTGSFQVGAVFDGAGKAAGVAKRAASLLERHVSVMSLGAGLRDEAWASVVRQLDLALGGGGPETTIVGAAVLGDEAVVFTAGDSRAYLVPFDGPTRMVTEDASKARLGSGEARPVVHRVKLAHRDTLALLSDGVWAPLGIPGIERAVRSVVLKDVTDVCEAILDAAGRRGRMDDQTCVVIRSGA